MRRLFIGLAALTLGGHPATACSTPGATEVDQIYPSAAVVPENLLRIYLYFTGPMGEADILPHITLRRADGTVVEGAFLANRYELWSPDRTRLTLLFDPGRVKTGLDAHDALGRALIAGERYVVMVEPRAQDASGCDLAAAYSHGFVAGPGDLEPPDPNDWVLDLPQAGTTDPLRVRLGTAHDHLSMAFRIRVKLDGDVLPGRVALENEESVWVFAPRAAWTSARHEVSIAEELEDLAGNRPGQLFDQPIARDLPPPTLQLWFAPTVTPKD